MSRQQQSQQQQQQYQQPPPQQHDHDDEEYDQQQPITVQELLAYSLRNYVFSLIGDVTSKLFVCHVERLNVMHQTENEIRACGIRRDLGGVLQAPRAILDMNIGSTIYSSLVMQVCRTTMRCFTSSAFYILEPNLGPVIANPTYFFYARPVVIDLLNLLCVYPIDTAATMAMADEPKQPVLREGPGALVLRVLQNPRDSLRGFGVTALGLVVYRASLATVSNVLVNKDWIPRGAINRFLLQNAVLFSCTALVYPFDTIRRRLIVRKAFRDALTSRSGATASSPSSSPAASATSSASESTEESTLQCVKRIYADEGVSGFFCGLSMRMTRMVGGAMFYGLIQYLEMRAAQME